MSHAADRRRHCYRTLPSTSQKCTGNQAREFSPCEGDRKTGKQSVANNATSDSLAGDGVAAAAPTRRLLCPAFTDASRALPAMFLCPLLAVRLSNSLSGCVYRHLLTLTSRDFYPLHARTHAHASAPRARFSLHCTHAHTHGLRKKYSGLACKIYCAPYNW